MKKSLLLLVVVVWSTAAFAQINLGQKAEEKADQVIDELLFGKKKKKTTSSEDPEVVTPVSPTENYETSDNNESDPLGGYVQGEVDYDKLSSASTVPFRDLINFLPNKAGNYVLSQKPQGSTMKYGEWNYSFGQKVLSNGDKTLTIGIFDYLTAGALLTPYTQQYEYESTDGELKSVVVSDQPGWYSVNYGDGSSSLVLVVKNRYYVTYSGNDLSKEKLTEWASELKLNRLPEGQPVETTED